jgi:hypothetical protein
VPVVEIVVLPLTLLEAFHRTKDPCQDLGASLAISVAAYGSEQPANQDDVMVNDHPQRMHRHYV